MLLFDWILFYSGSQSGFQGHCGPVDPLESIWAREETNKCYTALQQIQDNDRLIGALKQYILTRKLKEKQWVNSEQNWVVTYCPSSSKQENVGTQRTDGLVWDWLSWLVNQSHSNYGKPRGPKFIIMKKMNIEYWMGKYKREKCQVWRVVWEWVKMHDCHIRSVMLGSSGKG